MEGYEYSKGDFPKPIIKDNMEWEGVTIRCIKDLWNQATETNKKFTVNCSFLQLYNERVYDLLNLSWNNEGLKIRWTKESQFQVENLFIFECLSADDAVKYFQQGLTNKVVASHKLNHASSRSHSIFTITF